MIEYCFDTYIYMQIVVSFNGNAYDLHRLHYVLIGQLKWLNRMNLMEH